MKSTEIIASCLEGLRESLLADGYDLHVDELVDGTAKLRITAGPEACADCLVPKTVMLPMLQEALKKVSEVERVAVSYPAE